MFNVGGGELLVIMLVALIVLGPQRLPDAARQIGKTMGDLRRLSTGFQNEMRGALDFVDAPDRVTDRRNVLGADLLAPADEARTDAAESADLGTAMAGAVAAVSERGAPSPAAEPSPPKSSPRAKKATASTKKAPAARKTSTKPKPKANPAKAAAAKKAAPAKKQASSVRAPGARRTPPR